MLPLPTPSPDQTFRIALHEGSRLDLWSLFELADDSTVAILEYLDQGVVHVATIGGLPVGYSQVLPTEGGVYELRSLAVLPRRRRRGLGTRLVARSASWVRDRSGNRLVAGIPSSGLDVLGFCQRLGFRVLRVDRDAYGPEHGYPDGLHANGIRVRDRVWLELEL
jgi:GNAT superfamily N-acetyltransferase